MKRELRLELLRRDGTRRLTTGLEIEGEADPTYKALRLVEALAHVLDVEFRWWWLPLPPPADGKEHPP